MLTLIDDLTTTTGWSGPTGSAFSTNAFSDYISNHLSGSLMIYIPPNSKGLEFSKTVAANVAGAFSITMGVWSRQCRKTSQNYPSDYFYQVDFGNENVFMLPTPMNFDSVDFGINGWSSVSRIGIIPTTNDEDWIIISGCYAVTDEYPKDVFVGVKTGLLEALADMNYSYSMGVFSCVAGASSVAFSSWPPFLDKNTVLTFTDGVNTEHHQIARWDESDHTVWFSGEYDGSAMLYSYSAGSASLYLPVEFGTMEIEAIIPGIAIWGMEASPNQDESDVFQIVDTFMPLGGAATRRNVFMQNYHILIDCEARQAQVLAMLSRAVRWWIGKQLVWINGRKNDIGYESDVHAIDPPEGVVQIPKIQYRIDIEVHEERDMRTFLPAYTGAGTLTFAPKQGVLAGGKTGGNNDV